MSRFDFPWEDDREEDEPSRRKQGGSFGEGEEGGFVDEIEPAPFAGYVPLRLPDYRDAPPSQDLQWATIVGEWGEDALFYKTPEQEYLLNSYSLNLPTMQYRWAGLGYERMIVDLFTNPKWPIERTKAQAIRQRDMGLPDPTETQWKEQVHRAQVFRLVQDIENIQNEIDQRIEVEKVNIRNAHNGTITHTEEKTWSMSSKTLDNLRKRLVEYMNAYRELQGDTIKKIETTLEVGPNMSERLGEAMKANGWRALNGMSMEELEAAYEKALIEDKKPRHELQVGAVEGEIVADNAIVLREGADT